MLRASEGVIKPMVAEVFPEAIATDPQTRQEMKPYIAVCLSEIMQTQLYRDTFDATWTRNYQDNEAAMMAAITQRIAPDIAAQIQNIHQN